MVCEEFDFRVSFYDRASRGRNGGIKKMKRIIVLCVSLMIASLMFAGSSAAVDLSNALGIWLFDEGSGSTAGDSSGNGNDGTLNGGVTWVTGYSGSALEFNGTDGYVSTGKQLLQAVPEFTIVLWISKGNVTASRVGLVGQNDTVEMGLISPTNVQLWSEGAGTNADASYTYPSGEWHFIAVTGDPTSLKNYLDGQLITTTNVNVPNHGSSTYNVNIGGGGIFDATGNWYTGMIDEVAIFSVALVEDDIVDIMNNGLGVNVAVSPALKLATSWGKVKVEY